MTVEDTTTGYSFGELGILSDHEIRKCYRSGQFEISIRILKERDMLIAVR